MAMKIKTLIVDDSVFYRGILKELLQKIDSVELVASAANGSLALAKIDRHVPDLVTLDVEMPGMDGLAVLKEIRQRHPEVLVVMISSATKASARVTIEALEEGALDFIEKPNEDSPELNGRVLYRQLRRVVSVVETKMILNRRENVSAGTTKNYRVSSSAGTNPVDIVAIGISTGGPLALPPVLEVLPASFPVPIIIVQHMPAMFVTVLKDSLNLKSNLPVVEATSNMRLQKGHVYLAPGGRQAKIIRGPVHGSAMVVLTDDPPENFCRPSADYMFRSVANVYGGRVLALIMTGMGKDGVAGLRVLKEMGATVYAQDEASSVVYGMAMEAENAGVVDRILPLSELGRAVRKRVGS